MSAPDAPLSQVIGKAQTRAIQDALKPHLLGAGVRTAEKRIGKPARFFANIRQRDTLKVRDLLATCVALELDPVEFLREALGDDSVPAVRPPRIIGRASKLLHQAGPGIGAKRLAELELALQLKPRHTRSVLGRELEHARREEIPRILGLYGSSYRVESDLDRAGVVLTRALEMARELRLPAAEADLLIRRSYVDLERDHLQEALRRAEKATAISARIDDREGEGIAFLATGMFRYYRKQYTDCLENLEAVLKRPVLPQFLFGAHQGSALCWIELNQEDEARSAVERARELLSQVDSWIHGKLSWIESRLVYGPRRLGHLQAARDALSRHRPADCALVTVELIEEALAMGRNEIAEREALQLCTLLEKTGNLRVERAILYLTRHHTRLTPKMVLKIKRAVDAVQARRLSRLIASDH